MRSAPERSALLESFGLILAKCGDEYGTLGVEPADVELLTAELADYVDELEERAFAGGRPAAADPVDDEQLLEQIRQEVVVEDLPACVACGVTEVRVVSGHVSCASCGTAKEAPRG